ncbi:MAG: bifunctional (p)ppGpp synthetase/guanosine-3',5'-bis(diphosphate) 3'-pyrophosphohydrolase, partial [Burkholderiales bacterium]
GEVSGRPKHIVSIHNKMRVKRLAFDEIYDVRALRVIVDEVAQCYQVLSLVHEMWTPVEGEYDDYIARPKPNGYQSLH